MITLNEEEVKGVLDYLNEQPAKIANPLINFFNIKINQLQQAQQSDTVRPGPHLAEEIEVDSPELIPSPETDPVDD